MKPSLRSAVIAAVTVCFLIWADQATKILAVRHLKGQDSFPLIPGVLEFRYLENRGAAFGILQNNRLFFVVIAVVVIIALCIFYLRLPAAASPGGRSFIPLRACIILMTAGAAGNLIDRLSLVYVRDFIYFSLIDFPIFNVADIYVTVSVFLMIILLFFYYKEEDLQFKDRRREDD